MRDLAIQNAIGAMQRAHIELPPDSTIRNDLVYAIDGLLQIDRKPVNLYDKVRKAGILPMPTKPDIEYSCQRFPLNL